MNFTKNQDILSHAMYNGQPLKLQSMLMDTKDVGILH